MPAGDSFYWDASAVLSLLVEDLHTPKAKALLSPRRAHFLSSLGVAEVLAVLGRDPLPALGAKRQEFLRDVIEGFWRLSHLLPSVTDLGALAERHRLRGADLWHLGAALSLKKELPDLRLITFDLQLARASRREGIFCER